MEKNKKIPTSNGFDFPWNISTKQGDEKYTHLDRYITMCEQDYVAILKEKINLSDVEKLFEYTNISLFVHHSQITFHPVYCILWDITIIKRPTDFKEIVLFISKKFTDKNFQDKDKEKFQVLLYSEENQKRLKAFGLKLYPIEEYYKVL